MKQKYEFIVLIDEDVFKVVNNMNSYETNMNSYSLIWIHMKRKYEFIYVNEKLLIYLHMTKYTWPKNTNPHYKWNQNFPPSPIHTQE